LKTDVIHRFPPPSLLERFVTADQPAGVVAFGAPDVVSRTIVTIKNIPPAAVAENGTLMAPPGLEREESAPMSMMDAGI
jgi:hypothetical protein